MSLEICTTLPLPDFVRAMPMDGRPFVRVSEVAGVGTTVSLATWPRVTGEGATPTLADPPAARPARGRGPRARAPGEPAAAWPAVPPEAS